MAHYFVGDIQGCFAELELLLVKVGFNPSKDELWSVGDLVARGPGSLEVLRYMKSLEGSAKIVLGNHDLHLMSIHNKIKKSNPKDQLQALLQANDIQKLINWLRLQPLHQELDSNHGKIVMSHAGIPPQWGMKTLRKASKQVSEALAKPDYAKNILARMYTQEPEAWSKSLSEFEQIRYSINALTRMRYLYTDGRLDFDCKLPPNKNTNTELQPWFNHAHKLAKKRIIVFGHWAALMGKVEKDNIKALDTGCCWGAHMTLWHLEADELVTQNRLKRD